VLKCVPIKLAFVTFDCNEVIPYKDIFRLLLNIVLVRYNYYYYYYCKKKRFRWHNVTKTARTPYNAKTV